MGFFKRTSGPLVDGTLPDAQWLAVSEQVYDQQISRYYGSPETMARGAHDAAGRGDIGVALFFYQKSIDMLHTAYGFAEMRSRRPGPPDVPIIQGFNGLVEAIGRERPQASLAPSVREVTHRLRSISTTCQAQGLDGSIYLAGLRRLAAAAPDVPVDDVFWT
jgi:hypothetical protein